MHCRHVVPANQRARRVFKCRVRSHQHDGAETDDKGQYVEVTHKPGGVEDALARFAGIAHGEETHQDMWQACGTKHQTQTE